MAMFQIICESDIITPTYFDRLKLAITPSITKDREEFISFLKYMEGGRLNKYFLSCDMWKDPILVFTGALVCNPFLVSKVLELTVDKLAKKCVKSESTAKIIGMQLAGVVGFLLLASLAMVMVRATWATNTGSLYTIFCALLIGYMINLAAVKLVEKIDSRIELYGEAKTIDDRVKVYAQLMELLNEKGKFQTIEMKCELSDKYMGEIIKYFNVLGAPKEVYESFHAIEEEYEKLQVYKAQDPNSSQINQSDMQKQQQEFNQENQQQSPTKRNQFQQEQGQVKVFDKEGARIEWQEFIVNFQNKFQIVMEQLNTAILKVINEEIKKDLNGFDKVIQDIAKLVENSDDFKIIIDECNKLLVNLLVIHDRIQKNPSNWGNSVNHARIKLVHIIYDLEDLIDFTKKQQIPEIRDVKNSQTQEMEQIKEARNTKETNQKISEFKATYTAEKLQQILQDIEQPIDNVSDYFTEVQQNYYRYIKEKNSIIRNIETLKELSIQNMKEQKEVEDQQKKELAKQDIKAKQKQENQTTNKSYQDKILLSEIQQLNSDQIVRIQEPKVPTNIQIRNLIDETINLLKGKPIKKQHLIQNQIEIMQHDRMPVLDALRHQIIALQHHELTAEQLNDAIQNLEIKLNEEEQSLINQQKHQQKLEVMKQNQENAKNRQTQMQQEIKGEVEIQCKGDIELKNRLPILLEAQFQEEDQKAFKENPDFTNYEHFMKEKAGTHFNKYMQVAQLPEKNKAGEKFKKTEEYHVFIVGAQKAVQQDIEEVTAQVTHKVTEEFKLRYKDLEALNMNTANPIDPLLVFSTTAFWASVIVSILISMTLMTISNYAFNKYKAIFMIASILLSLLIGLLMYFIYPNLNFGTSEEENNNEQQRKQGSEQNFVQNEQQAFSFRTKQAPIQYIQIQEEKDSQFQIKQQ